MINDFWMNAFEKKKSFVNIQGNRDCKIENINVNMVSMPPNMLNLQNNYDSSTYSRMYLPKLQISRTALDRSSILNDKLKEFIKITKQTNAIPIVRYMGLYSGLCTHWEKSITSDIVSLEIEERELMIELVKIGCDVRILISLDILKAILCGYSKRDIQARVSDLCGVCDELKDYKNFNLAVDSTNITEPILILANNLFCKSYNYNGMQNGKYHGNYSYSVWSSLEKEMYTLVTTFDWRFMNARVNNQQLMFLLNINSYSQLLYYIVSQKLLEVDIE